MNLTKIKRWLYMEKELPRKMMQDTGNQKQFGMGIGDDRFGNSGSRKSGTGG